MFGFSGDESGGFGGFNFSTQEDFNFEKPDFDAKHLKQKVEEQTKENQELKNLVQQKDAIILKMSKEVCGQEIVTKLLIQGVCSYHFTNDKDFTQKFYRCHTCPDYGPNEGVCEACAKICHQGHKLKYVGKKSCFCDCGYKQSNNGWNFSSPPTPVDQRCKCYHNKEKEANKIMRNPQRPICNPREVLMK
jgi:hypothetical protein